MIRPGGFRGAAFGSAAEGDVRLDDRARRVAARELGISAEWATVTQVHGSRVVEATAPGNLGEADAIFTARPGLPAAVAAADCVPIVLEGDSVVAVVHAGWRGAAAGVVDAAIDRLNTAGTPPRRAAIGPAIGPCCYEVGADVADRFPDHVSRTTWGSTSVDLPRFIAGSLEDLEVWRSPMCTYTSPQLHSYRRDATKQRQVAVGWLPDG